MATAEELLRSTVVQPDPEGHIVVGGDRKITVPANLKRLGVQHDNDMETVVFDCPRYWDDQDMSKMVIYIHYMRSDGYKDRYIARNVTVDGDIMHFEWTISNNVTAVPGPISFLVCIKNTNFGLENRHWNSELCQDAYVSPGMEFDPDYEFVYEAYQDLITELLLRMDSVEQINIQADEMQALHDATVEVANTAEEIKNEALDASNYIKNSYANAIKGTASGEIIRVDDVSPIEHEVKCRVHGKNFFNVSKIPTTSASVSSAYVSEVGEDYVIVSTLEGYTGNGYCTVPVKVRDTCPGLEVGRTYTLNADTESDSSNIYLPGIQKSWVFGTAMVMTEEILNSTMTLYGFSMGSGLGPGECRISNIQIEEGTVVTEYEPYIDPSNTKVFRCGKNMIDVDMMCNAALTKSGDTYTFKKGEISDERFSDVMPLYIPANTGVYISANFEKYTVSDAALYMIVKYEDGTEAFPGIQFKESGRYLNLAKNMVGIQFYIQGSEPAGAYLTFRNMQMEIGEAPTSYDPYVDIVETSVTDGTCVVTSKSPTMTLLTDTPGVTIEAEYNVDTKTWLANHVGSGGGGGSVSWLTSVSLPVSSWMTESTSLHSQVVTIAGTTMYSKVDLLPSVEQLAIFHDKDVAFVTENEDGVITVYAIGDKPTQNYTMQAQITEVTV